MSCEGHTERILSEKRDYRQDLYTCRQHEVIHDFKSILMFSLIVLVELDTTNVSSKSRCQTLDKEKTIWLFLFKHTHTQIKNVNCKKLNKKLVNVIFYFFKKKHKTSIWLITGNDVRDDTHILWAQAWCRTLWSHSHLERKKQ